MAKIGAQDGEAGNQSRPKRPSGTHRPAIRRRRCGRRCCAWWRPAAGATCLTPISPRTRGRASPPPIRPIRPRPANLTGIGRDIDARLFGSLDEDPLDGSAKDRLFDLLMRRFDALNAHREAYAALAWELPRTPLEGGCLLFQLRRSLANMLEAAGLSASGLRGALRIEGLGAIYACALRVWLKDETADLSKTMAELDKRLVQVERWLDMTRRKSA